MVLQRIFCQNLDSFSSFHNAQILLRVMSYSDWYRVQSGIPQSSILGPFLFLIYINNLTSVIQDTECRNYLHVDDAKIYRNITDVEDVQCLQRVIERVIKWCAEWLLPLNVDKCKGMTLTSNIAKDTSYNVNIKESIHNIQKVDCIKDLGILIDSQLTFKDHIQAKINKAYSMIGLL